MSGSEGFVVVIYELFDAMSCDFAAELGAHEFGGGAHADASVVESVGIPAGADGRVIV